MKEPERAFMDEALGCENLVASSGELRLSVQVLSAAYSSLGSVTSVLGIATV